MAGPGENDQGTEQRQRGVGAAERGTNRPRPSAKTASHNRGVVRSQTVQALDIRSIRSASFDVVFSAKVTHKTAVEYIFGRNEPPSGFEVVQESRPQSVFRVKHENKSLGQIGKNIDFNLYLLLQARIGNPPPLPTWEEWKRQQTSTGLTIGELLELGSGAHEVNGYFVWIGTTTDGLTVEPYPYFKDEDLNRDVRFFLEHGTSLSEALRLVEEQWALILQQAVLHFSFALTDIAGAFGSRRRQARNISPRSARFQRQLEQIAARSARPIRQHGRLLSKVGETVLTGVAAFQSVKQVIEAKKELDEEALLEEFTQTMEADAQAVHKVGFAAGFAAIAVVGTPQVVGKFGEQFAKDFLEARGYEEVLALQNPSGQGIDLVGLKCWEKQGLRRCVIVYFEIKTSTRDIPGKLSKQQRDVTTFVRKRLSEIANRRGRYKNMPKEAVRLARKLLMLHKKEDIPIGGIVIDITQVKGWRVLGFALKLSIRRWVRKLKYK